MNNIEIEEAYKNYKPPVNATAVVQALSNSVPNEYLGGLKQIVLTNSSGLARDKRRGKTLYRKRKVKIAESCALYHQQWQGSPA